MGFALEQHDHYLEIVFDGILVKQTILESLNQLLNHPEYYEKHSLWNMSASRLGFSIGDAKEIIGVMHLFKPKQKHFANKSVLLVSGPMGLSMVRMFTEMAQDLPFEFSVFSDHSQARAHLGNN